MEKILELYTSKGYQNYFGENVSKTTHMIQAAMMAEKEKYNELIVLACLLHDIGHFLEKDDMNGLGVIDHGKLGADFLRKLHMNEKVCHLVENHVMAKRYLVTKDKKYYQNLSEASKKTFFYQGGKMTQKELEHFEKDKQFQDILKVRYCDDNGKNISIKPKPLESYNYLIKKYLLGNMNKVLQDNGFLLFKDFFNQQETQQIIDFKTQLENLKEEKGKWMIYYEEKNGEKLKSRIENFLYYQKNILEFVNSKLKSLLEDILKEEIVIFKDKMNWKLPKAEGFQAHQDHLAWNDFNVSRFFSIALFADKCTRENGCLEFVTNKANKKLFSEEGCLPLDIEKSMFWDHITTEPCDLLIFDSFVPHRSSRNNSTNSRSILYFTYNYSKEGSFYKEYNQKKRKFFPPPNERINEVVYDINKYNLANPLQ